MIKLKKVIEKIDKIEMIRGEENSVVLLIMWLLINTSKFALMTTLRSIFSENLFHPCAVVSLSPFTYTHTIASIAFCKIKNFIQTH